jgi:pimeloyl-ACP methyl ester carboxylesterase
MTTGPLPAAAPWPTPDGLRVIDVNGYPLSYRDEGSGPPVVLLHGSFSDARAWSLQVPEFAARYRLLAPCLRHYYPERWDGRGSDFSVSQHADDVAAFIVSAGLRKVHLVGHSRGGAVALTVARRHAGLVRSLVLADPRGLESLLPDTPEDRELAVQLAASFAALQRALAAGDPDQAARGFVDALSGPGAWDRRSPELKRVFLDNIGTAVDTGEAPALTCGDIAGLRMPILLVGGEHSPKRYRAMFDAMRACNSAIPAPVTIPRAAHAMNRDNPGAFNAAVLRFLAQ